MLHFFDWIKKTQREKETHIMGAVKSGDTTNSIKRHNRLLLVAYMQSRAHTLTHSLGTIHHSHLFAKMFKCFAAFFFCFVWFDLCSFEQTAIYSHSSDAFVADFNLLHRFHIIIATWWYFCCSLYSLHSCFILKLDRLHW